MVAEALTPFVATASATIILTMVSSCLTRGGSSTACVMSVWRNSINCRWIFMFPMKISARSGLMVMVYAFSVSYHYLKQC